MCYTKAEASQPLQYTAKGVQQFPGVEKRSFELISQTWAPHDLPQPGLRKHTVDIYIPSDALLDSPALLIANSGINYPGYPRGGTQVHSDFNEDAILSITQKTRTPIVSVSNIPNQYLIYKDDKIARQGDDSVAHSWKLFLKKPENRPFMSLYIPMVQAMVAAMNLAQKELPPSLNVNQFIATGISKRGWTAWLAAIADPDKRIQAIVPFVIDILNTRKVLEHIYQTYGKNWPLAFFFYEREGITEKFWSKNFDKLLKIHDPLRYLKSPYAKRLKIPTYDVTASGDDFFPPDSTQFYFEQLPGEKALRVVPNSTHLGIREFAEESLISVTNRLQRGQRFPVIKTHIQNKGGKKILSLHFTEKPVKVTQWTAMNSTAPDFRYDSGIRYHPKEIVVTKNRKAQVIIPTPKTGWNATFIEAKFFDGFVTTTPVYITPNTYSLDTSFLQKTVARYKKFLK